MRTVHSRRIGSILLAVLLAGCATTPPPYTGQGPHPQIERGAAVPPIDLIANFFALPIKLLLWNRKVANHSISAGTEQDLVDYLGTQTLPAINDTKFRLNEYRPGQDLSRLVHNRHVAWPYRLLFGLPTTLIIDVLLPGRLFPWGDYYNPFTNTTHLYSDHTAVALHEAGHAHDFAKRRWKGTYAVLRIIPGVDLFQEYKASKEAIRYLKDEQELDKEMAAYKVLYPAYGTYVGSYIFAPIGTIVGAVLGHASGRSKAAARAREARGETLPTAPAPLSETRDQPAGVQPIPVAQ